jgi:uncharacterized membrane protein
MVAGETRVIALPEWHPMAVHFPLALTVTGALALSAARVAAPERRGATLAVVGTWNLCLGAVGALFALGTGLAAVTSLELAPAARAAVGLHVKWAIFTSAALVLLAVWRGAGVDPDSRPSRAFLVILWAVTAALIVTAYQGGQNVYRYGVGTAQGAELGALRPQGDGHELERV